MKKTYLYLLLSTTLSLFLIGSENSVAQNFPNFDPQQVQQMISRMQQQAVDTLHDELEVTNETDWRALEPLITKVIQSKTDAALGGGGMVRMIMGNRGNNFPGLSGLDPDAEALQKLIDDGAPTKQIRDGLERYRAVSKRKADELAKTQEQLRRLLTPRQEAVLSMSGLMD